MAPETVTSKKGKKYQRRALLKWSPKKCFCQDDLYTVKVGSWSTDEIEKRFFGPIDAQGERAVEFFANFSMRNGVHEAFRALIPYMDAQRFRTPRGLDWLKSRTDIRNQNLTLITMQKVFQYHATMWQEGVWEIVNARQSPTKFLLTDQPVTFYNAKAFPKSVDCRFPHDVELGRVGTRTIFPLGLETCLIITHLQLVRNPWANPKKPRVNARSYEQTIIDFSDIQFGRELEEDEVLRINFILKQRATRYIAATEKEWLYPENKASTTHWSKLDNDWFLFPHLYKIPFSGGISVGYKDGTSWAMDEYGRTPGHPDYEDEHLREQELRQSHKAQIAWAIKREGRSIAHVGDEFRGDAMHDEIMSNALEAYRNKRQRGNSK